MSDISEVTEDAEPKPLVIRVGKVDREAFPFSMLQVGRIQKAIKRLPCPYDTKRTTREMNAKLAAGEVTTDQVAQAVRHCAAKEQSWPPRIMEDAEAQELLMFEESVQVAFIREAFKLTSDGIAEEHLIRIKPADYLKVMMHCFQIGGDDSDPKDPATSPASDDGSTTTNSSPTSSPAPDGVENTSSVSPSATFSGTPG